jgi:hypothetical protein
MTMDYIQALVALGPVGVAMGEISAVTPCALGYCARVGAFTATGPTPAEAVKTLLAYLADLCAKSMFLGRLRSGAGERERLCDALAKSFEHVGGRWWEV